MHYRIVSHLRLRINNLLLGGLRSKHAVQTNSIRSPNCLVAMDRGTHKRVFLHFANDQTRTCTDLQM